MGHHCCRNQKVTRGSFTPEEDKKLSNYMTDNAMCHWNCIPKLAGLERCGKSCRLRWINYLKPGLKKGPFSQEEERIIRQQQRMLGNKWAQISKHLPGRTDNDIKNFWNSNIKKKIAAEEKEKKETKLCLNTNLVLPVTLSESRNQQPSDLNFLANCLDFVPSTLQLESSTDDLPALHDPSDLMMFKEQVPHLFVDHNTYASSSSAVPQTDQNNNSKIWSIDNLQS